MSIQSGYKKVKDYILESSGYKLLSRWTSSNTVEFDDGTTAQDKVGAVKGITASTTATDAGYAASATQMNPNVSGSLAAKVDSLDKSIVKNVNSLNLKLGKVYNDTTVITKNIPAAKKTTFIRFNNIDFGTYIVFAKVSLTTTQPTGGALLSLEINNSAFVEEVPNINFLGSATVCGYAVISKTTDSISASYYSINSVTISSAELVAIRIS